MAQFVSPADLRLVSQFRFQSRRYGIIAAPATARPAAESVPTIGGSVLAPSPSKRKEYVGWAEGDDSDDSGPAGGFKAPRAGGAGKRFGLSPEALPPKRMLTRPRCVLGLERQLGPQPHHRRFWLAGNNSSR